MLSRNLTAMLAWTVNSYLSLSYTVIHFYSKQLWMRYAPKSSFNCKRMLLFGLYKIICDSGITLLYFALLHCYVVS